ncbi:MAG TPA: DUF4192 domain-containing protein [Nakamurella sp.]
MDDHCGDPRIRINDPGGLLAVAANTLGFHPTDSLVLACFTGDRCVLGPVARVDLPRGRDPGLVCYLTGTALTHADRVAVLCYPRRRRRPAIVDALVAELVHAGIGVMSVLIVHAGRVWEAPSARPLRLTEGFPLPGDDDPTVRALAAENALAGRVVLADREQLRASIAGPRGPRRRVAERAIAAVTQGHGARLPDTADPPDRMLGLGINGLDGPSRVKMLPERIIRVIDCALAEVNDTGTVDVELAAELAVACRQIPIRDGVLVRGIFALDRTWLAMLISCATWTPDDQAAGICAVLSAIAYRHGEGALAQVSADRCLLVEPENNLIHLLLATMSAGLPPDVLDGLLMPPEGLDGDEFDGDEFDGRDGHAVA